MKARRWLAGGVASDSERPGSAAATLRARGCGGGVGTRRPGVSSPVYPLRAAATANVGRNPWLATHGWRTPQPPRAVMDAPARANDYAAPLDRGVPDLRSAEPLA